MPAGEDSHQQKNKAYSKIKANADVDKKMGIPRSRYNIPLPKKDLKTTEIRQFGHLKVVYPATGAKKRQDGMDHKKSRNDNDNSNDDDEDDDDDENDDDDDEEDSDEDNSDDDDDDNGDDDNDDDDDDVDDIDNNNDKNDVETGNSLKRFLKQKFSLFNSPVKKNIGKLKITHPTRNKKSKSSIDDDNDD